MELASETTARGILPTPEALWRLDVDEVRQFDQGWRPDAAFMIRREQEMERLNAISMPDLLHRFDDLPSHPTRSSTAPHDGRWTGISLTTGEVKGQAWMLRGSETVLPAGFFPNQTILVACSVDAGWNPTFGCVQGVVVDTSGDLSHGSIILREIGLPAITNAQHVTQQIKTGDRLVLRVDVGVVEVAKEVQA